MLQYSILKPHSGYFKKKNIMLIIVMRLLLLMRIQINNQIYS